MTRRRGWYETAKAEPLREPRKGPNGSIAKAPRALVWELETLCCWHVFPLLDANDALYSRKKQL